MSNHQDSHPAFHVETWTPAPRAAVADALDLAADAQRDMAAEDPELAHDADLLDECVLMETLAIVLRSAMAGANVEQLVTLVGATDALVGSITDSLDQDSGDDPELLAAVLDLIEQA
jgi:hypothetical protein